MATIIQQRRGTAAEWTAANTILANGEKGLETDGLGTTEVKEKIGNGVLAWNDLPYQESGGGGAVDSVNGETGNVVLDGTDIELVNGGIVTVTEAISDISTEVTNLETNKVNSVLTGEPTGSDKILNIVSLTQAEYDAGTPIATTLYNITDA